MQQQTEDFNIRIGLNSLVSSFEMDNVCHLRNTKKKKKERERDRKKEKITTKKILLCEFNVKLECTCRYSFFVGTRRIYTFKTLITLLVQ